VELRDLKLISAPHTACPIGLVFAQTIYSDHNFLFLEANEFRAKRPSFLYWETKDEFIDLC